MTSHVSQIATVGTLVLILGTISHIFGISTDKWTSVRRPSRPSYRHGLFQECVDDMCKEIDGDTFRFDNDRRQSVIALAVIGVLVAIATTVLATVTLVILCCTIKLLKSIKVKIILCVVVFVSEVAAGVIILVSVIIHATSVYGYDKIDAYSLDNDHAYTHLSTSFVMSTVGGVVLVVGACIYALGTWLVIKDQRNSKGLMEDTAHLEKSPSQLGKMYLPPRF